MGIQVSETEPQLIGVFDNYDDPELSDVRRMVENLNHQLIDSGFDHYQYTVELRGPKAYVVKV